MPIIKKHSASSKKVKEPSFTKKQVESTSFKEKIGKANKLLSETVFLKNKRATTK
jgi:hypothetical protein